MQALQRRNQRGFIQSAELIFIAVILVIGLVTGWTVLRNQVVGELYDTAKAIGAIDHGFAYTSLNHGEFDSRRNSSIGDDSTSDFSAGTNFRDAPEVGQGEQIRNEDARLATGSNPRERGRFNPDN